LQKRPLILRSLPIIATPYQRHSISQKKGKNAKLKKTNCRYSLFYRALLQKRPSILRSLPIIATSYQRHSIAQKKGKNAKLKKTNLPVGQLVWCRSLWVRNTSQDRHCQKHSIAHKNKGNAKMENKYYLSDSWCGAEVFGFVTPRRIATTRGTL